MKRIGYLMRELARRVPAAVLITAAIWRDIGFVLLLAVSYPVRLVIQRRRRAKRLRASVVLPVARALR